MPQQLVVGDAAEAFGRVAPGRHRGPDQRAVERQVPGQVERRPPADAFALQRPPRHRQGQRRQHRIGGDVGAEPAQVAHEDRPGPPCLDRCQQRRGPAVRPRPEQRRLGRDVAEIDRLVEGVVDLAQEQLQQRLGRPPDPSTRPGPQDAGGGGQHGVGRIAGGAGGLGRGQERVAVQVDVGGDGDVGQRIVVRAVALAQHREAEIGLERLPGRLQHRHAVQAGHLRRRVHHRGARRRPSSTGG